MRGLTLFLLLIYSSIGSAQYNFWHNFLGKCNNGFHRENNRCTNNIAACPITNGSGQKVWANGSYGSCLVTGCNSGFIQSGQSCIANCSLTRTSCLAHFNAGCRGDGYFNVNTTDGSRQLFCDMGGGGWTLVIRIASGSRSHESAGQSLYSSPLGTVAVALGAGFSKLSDTDINAISVNKVYKFDCGNVSYLVRNAQQTWTTVRNNGYSWEINRARDYVSWTGANRAGYTFSDFPYNAPSHVNYISQGAAEGNGCYHDGEGWGLSGSFWVK